MATAFASAIAKSLSIIYSLLYSSLLYSSLSIVSPEIPGNAAFSAYPRGYAFKTVFPLRLYCFSWYFGTTARAVSYDPFINFSTQFSTFRVILVFPRRFSAVIHGNDRKCIKKCISVPKMSFYENNRAGNAVLSAFPEKILQKTAIKKRASRPSCARNAGRLVLLCGSCWGVLSESGS